MAPVSVDLSKLSDEVKNILNKKQIIMLRSKILKIKHLITDQSKCTTTPEFNEITAKNLTARVKQAKLATNNNTAGVENETN